MGKIFKYECRRLLINKFFLGLLLVTLFYGWQVLDQMTILGVSHTAPFSPWSYGDYLSRMLPLLWLGSLFFLTFFTSKAEARRAVLTAATPVDPKAYGRVRCCSALAGTGLLCLAVVLLSAVFYGRMFRWCHWETLLLPTLFTLVPPVIFALGSGWVLGHLRPWLIYVWMLLPFLLRAMPLPSALGLWNGSLFTTRPLALGSLDPAFSLPSEAAAIQCLLFLTGAVLLLKPPRHPAGPK